MANIPEYNRNYQGSIYKFEDRFLLSSEEGAFHPVTVLFVGRYSKNIAEVELKFSQRCFDALNKYWGITSEIYAKPVYFKLNNTVYFEVFQIQYSDNREVYYDGDVPMRSGYRDRIFSIKARNIVEWDNRNTIANNMPNLVNDSYANVLRGIATKVTPQYLKVEIDGKEFDVKGEIVQKFMESDYAKDYIESFSNGNVFTIEGKVDTPYGDFLALVENSLDESFKADEKKKKEAKPHPLRESEERPVDFDYDE